MLIIGIGWGTGGKRSSNPLIVTLYPEEKTAATEYPARHGGPVALSLGGLIGIGIGQLNMGWQAKMAVVLIPAAVTLLLCMTSKFPAHGTPSRLVLPRVCDVQKKSRGHSFSYGFFAMFLTAASELAPGQWGEFRALAKPYTCRRSCCWFMSAPLMFVMRFLRGSAGSQAVARGTPLGFVIARRIGPCFLLSVANSPITGLLAATVWGHRRLLHVANDAGRRLSERFPRGGAPADGTDGQPPACSPCTSYFPRLAGSTTTQKFSLAGGKEAFDKIDGRPTGADFWRWLDKRHSDMCRSSRLLFSLFLEPSGSTTVPVADYRAETIATSPSSADLKNYGPFVVACSRCVSRPLPRRVQIRTASRPVASTTTTNAP